MLIICVVPSSIDFDDARSESKHYHIEMMHIDEPCVCVIADNVSEHVLSASKCLIAQLRLVRARVAVCLALHAHYLLVDCAAAPWTTHNSSPNTNIYVCVPCVKMFTHVTTAASMFAQQRHPCIHVCAVNDLSYIVMS